MARKRYTPEQIISKLREAEVLSGKGKSVDQICKALQVHKHTYFRWKKEYGTMELNQLKRLKELEKENANLKKLVANQALDNSILKEALSGNY